MGMMELAAFGLAGSGIGAALGVPMVWPGARGSDPIRLMGGWLLGTSAFIAVISARIIGLLPDSAVTQHTINLLGLTAHPLLYLYVHRQTQTSRPTALALGLWMPATVYAVVLLVRLVLGSGTGVPFIWLLPVSLGYTAACAVLVARRNRDAQPEFVPATWVVAFLVLLNAAQVVRMLFGHVPPVRALVPLVLTLELVTIVALVVWRQVQQGPGPSSGAAAPRYARSGLNWRDGQALLARVNRALSVDRAYTDASLTLAGLAVRVDSTPHLVSEVLNRCAGTTFHDLVNRHRVDEVKAQLSDPAADGYTVEGIGASAGFGSRSALYAAFRRLEGMTPTEFRRRRS